MNKINSATPTSITRVEVEDLFFQYNYTLAVDELSKTEQPRLVILYGDNGCGKTTVLELLFHILSSENERGHRSFIARVPFRSFSVHLVDGTVITALREKADIGSYQILIIKNNKLIATSIYIYDDEKDRATSEDDSVVKNLKELNLVLFFLGDNRVLDSDIFEDNSRELRAWTEDIIYSTKALPRRLRERRLGLDNALNTSIERTRDWARRQVLSNLSSGVENVHTIYEDIISRIINSEETASKEDSSISFDTLVQELELQEQRSRDFSRFGLASPLKTEELVSILRSIDDSKKSVVWKVLRPYLDSVKARFDALQETQNILTTFVNTTNEFLHDKEIFFNVRDGLSIITNSKRKLFPVNLSSGEKQLLLLLCNTLTARDTATIFIIDEPEISLNIKWQRNLIRALLECTRESQVQFLIATHSIELISRYRGNIIKLENQLGEITNADI